MKVGELKVLLEGLMEDAEIMVFVSKKHRPVSVMKHITTISPVFEQDTGEMRYTINVDIENPLES